MTGSRALLGARTSAGGWRGTSFLLRRSIDTCWSKVNEWRRPGTALYSLVDSLPVTGAALAIRCGRSPVIGAIMNSNDKVALITGGGTGIGRAVSLALADDGYTVIVAGRRLEPLIEVAEQIARLNRRALAIAADVSQENPVRELFTRIESEFGRLDLLFNNAGTVAPPVPLEELTLSQWQAVIDVNVTGAFLCTQAAVRVMKKQTPRGGRIINNGSISAHTPRPNSAPYTVSKHAITGLTKSTALDGRAFDIACGQIDIGNAATAIGSLVSRGALQPDGSRLAEPVMDLAHVAQAVRYMASLPLTANVLSLTVMATGMPFVGRG
jgi:NAD(P)-dependent dehydrogenase (short-subunit alcohol dehydrogenase family)